MIALSGFVIRPFPSWVAKKSSNWSRSRSTACSSVVPSGRSTALTWMADMIRRLDQNDAVVVASIDSKLFPGEEWNESTVAREIKAGWAIGWEEQGELVAFLLARFSDDLADIIRLGTLPQHRRKGIARALLQHALDRIAGDTMLMVRRRNQSALRLYLSLGFLPRAQVWDGNSLLLFRSAAIEATSGR